MGVDGVQQELGSAGRRADRRGVHARRIGSADQRGFSPHEHFTVDGTFVEAWASHKSVRPKDDPSPPPSTSSPKNPDVNFCGETRSNATRQSVTDTDVAQNIKVHAQFRDVPPF